MQRRIKGTDRIKVAHQLTLKYENYPGFSEWDLYNHRGPLKWEMEAEKRSE